MITALTIISVLALLASAPILYALVFRKNDAKRDILLRYYIIFIFICSFFVLILFRIWYWQYAEGDELRAIAEQRWTEPDTIPAKRGNIRSDDGRLMASTIPTYYLYMDMRVEAFKVKDKETKREYFDLHVGELAKELSALFKDRTAAQYERDLRKAYKRRAAEYRIYPKPVSYIDYKKVKEFPILRRGRIQGGFTVKERVTRVKPFGSLASRTIGDIYGIGEKGGRFGLEMYYDSVLRGHNGLAINRKMAGRSTKILLEKPEDGLDVISTIDIDLQETVEKELLQELMRTQAEKGTAVLMEVSTGEIKAISNFEKSGDRYTERTNVAAGSEIEPGSTFKLLSYMVALEDGVIDTTTIVDTGNGAHKFADRIMKDWNYGGPKGGFGKISVPEAFYQSSNVAISMLIDRHYKDNPQKFIDGLKRTGICNPVDLEIPGHGRVKIKSPADKNWWETSLPWMSIGYESSVPPIFMLMMYNAVANNGKMMKPMFAKGISKNGVMVETFSPEVVCGQVCSPETLGKLQKMLVGVVEEGTAKQVRSDLFTIAGKTGTSQIFERGTNRDAEGRLRHQITFCGYFPAENPMYSCIVYVKEPDTAPSAGRICGTVFKNIAEKAFILANRKTAEGEALLSPDSVADIMETEASADLTADGILSDTGNRIPDVCGMPASEAVYILENLGLHVELDGTGRVKSQSLPAGSTLAQGKTIELILR